MSDDPVRDAFDRVAEQYATQFFHELDGKPWDRERLAAFAAACPRDAPVLEVGCGPGHVGLFVAGLGPRVIGLDVSEASLRVARRLVPGHAVVAGDMRALPVRAGAGGGLLAFYALIYFDAAATAGILGEYRRVLRPGAPLLLVVHGGEGHERFTDFRGTPIDVTLHYHRPEPLAEAVRRAGFEVTALETRPPYPTEHPTPRLYVSGRAR